MVEMGITLLLDSGLHQIFWTEATRTSVYLLNRVIVRLIPESTPDIPTQGSTDE